MFTNCLLQCKGLDDNPVLDGIPYGLSWYLVAGVRPDMRFIVHKILLRYELHADIVTTSAVLRLECSLDCISESMGHQQNIFRSFSHCQRFLRRKTKFKKI